MMRRLLIACVMGFWTVSGAGAATSADIDMLPVKIDLRDQTKIQRGARSFMNYCSGCHSLRYLRYSRMAEDLGLTTFAGEIDKDLLSNLIFTTAKVHDPIHIAMPPADAREWFGIVPPDLTLTARERGANWIYTYLKSFYADSARPFGTNNLLVPDVAMPNVLEPLIGRVVAVHAPNTSGEKPRISHLALVEQGTMNQQEFDSTVEDLVNFLVYVAEPVKLIRYRIGAWVMAFLAIFLIVASLLKKSYWRNIH